MMAQDSDRRLSILVVDDNRTAADALARLLRRGGDEVEARYDGESAILRMEEHPPDLVLTDLKMEPVDGLAVLQAARAHQPPIEVIVFTAYGGVDVAVRAMRMGARDFLTKPVTVEQVASRLQQLRSGGSDDTGADPEVFVAQAEASRRLLETLKLAAEVPSPVWIEGEIGSGRVYAARKLHQLSGSPHPLTVREATSAAPWPLAGTVVIPNVDDLPDAGQRALLRDLNQAPPELRIVATAGPDSRQRVAEGTLRADLYYKLSVVVIPIPPLRTRPEDIEPLLDLCLQTFAQRYGRPVPEVPAETRKRLVRHSWPGNIRELRNIAERTVVLSGQPTEIEVSERSPPGLPNLEPGFSLSAYLENLERRLITEALRKADGDRTEAGRLLGVERNTLRYKLKKYGLLDT